MAEISRLKNAEISNGNLINADDIAAELDQLVNAHNTNDTVLTDIVSGTKTFSGVKTFSGNNVYSGNNSFSGSNTHTGQENFARTADPGTPVDGDFWFNSTSNLLKYQDGTATRTLATTEDLLTRGFLAGLSLSTGTDTLNDIDIAEGSCRDATDAMNMVLAATLTKQSDAAWAVGTGAGGMDTGTKPTSGTLHIWLIKRSDTGVVDALFSISATSPTMPASYDYKRRIGSRRTDSSGNIINMHQYGDLSLYDTPPALDVDVTNQSTTSVTRTLSVPAGKQVEAIFTAYVSVANGTVGVYFRNLDLTDVAASNTASPLCQVVTANGSTQNGGGPLRVMTNTSGQIGTRSTAASTTLKIATLGWIDRRGKDD